MASLKQAVSNLIKKPELKLDEVKNSKKFSENLILADLDEIKKQGMGFKKDENGRLVPLMESVFGAMGTEEAEILEKSMTSSTGFLMEYNMLKQKQQITLKAECKELGLQAHYDHAVAIVTNEKKREPTDEEIALSLYTSNAFYKELNDAWRQVNPDKIKKYAYLASLFIKGFRNLPAHEGEVYRGTVLNIEDYKMDQTICWKGFTSTSLDQKMALEFLKGRNIEPGSAEKKVFFTIKGKSGRNIENISFFPLEREIVFRGYTSFKVTSILKPKENDINDITYIALEEEGEDSRGSKILLWVDDNDLTDEHKQIRNAYEKERVTFIRQKTTAQAMEYLRKEKHLLQRDSSGFRIVTDMARIENGTLVIDAGLYFIQQVKISFPEYNQPIMVFTGLRYEAANARKFVSAGIKNVIVTSSISKASDFVSFN